MGDPKAYLEGYPVSTQVRERLAAGPTAGGIRGTFRTPAKGRKPSTIF